MRYLAIAVLALGCSKPWIQHACEWSLAPTRDTLIYAADGALALRDAKGEHRVAHVGCLANAKHLKGLVAFGDGWSAIAWGFRLEGGGLHHGTSRVEDPFVCRVDFRAKTAHVIDPQLLTDRLRRMDLRGGARFLYDIDHKTLRVVDLAANRHALLEVHPEALVETGQRLRVVELERAQVGAHSIYRTTLVIHDFDLAQWPPALVDTRRVKSGGLASELVLSDDGQWLAYSGSPYYVGRETGGAIADHGLVDLQAGTIAFERVAQPGWARVTDIAPGPRVLVAWTTDPYATKTAAHAAWFDQRGAQVGRKVDTRAMTLRWLPSRSRVLAVRTCTHDLVELPP